MFLEQAEMWARERGLAEIELGVYELDAGAKNPYGKLGYDTVGRTMTKSLGTQTDGPETTREARR